MVNRIGGAIELIGLRAVILDIRQYSNSGRQIEATNVGIAKATEAAAVASAKSAQVTSRAMQMQATSAAIAQKSIAAARQYAATQTQLAAATQAVTAAEARLNAERTLASQARPRDPNTGRFLSQGAVAGRVGAAEAGLLAAKGSQDQLTASLATNKAASVAWGKAQVGAAKDATKASKEVVAASAAEAAALNKKTALEQKQAAQQASRAKLVTGTAAVAGGLAFAAIGVASLNSAAKYETQLTKIRNLTSATGADTEILKKKLLEMTKTLPSSPDQLGASAYLSLSSGIKDVDEALRITELSAKASAIGLGEAKDVTKILTATLNAYKGTGITAAQATDILVAGVKEGSAEATDLAQSLGRVIPVASNLGVGLDELVATVAALTNAGLDTSEATTGVLGIMNQLEKSTPDAEEALASVGLTIDQVRKSVQDKGFVATMQSLAKSFEGNTAAIRPLLPEVRGLNAFVSAFIVQGNNASTILESIRNSAGITNKAFDEVSKTFAFQADLLKNQLNVALIQIGSAVLPTVTAALQDLVKWLDQNQDAVKTFISEGLNVAIEIIKDFAGGIGLAIDALSWLPDNEQAIVAAVVAIGAAFAWALPGGPILKGLQLMVLLLGALSKEGGIGDKAADFLNEKLGLGTKANAEIRPEDFRTDIKRTGSIEKAVNDRFGDSGFGKALAEDFIKNLKSQGVDTTKGVEEFDRALAKVNDTAQETTKIGLKPIVRNVSEVGKASDKAAKELKKLAEEFATSSEAAGQFGSFTKDFKKFGEISQEIATAFNLDAVAAGNVQAADAIVRAYERTANKGFEYTKTLATVAAAYRQNAAVARDIVLELARSALEAAQKAASAVFQNPTREVANLNIPLAQSRLRESQISLAINPIINSLNRQLKGLDRAMRDLDRQQKRRQKERERAQKAAEEEHKRQQTAQNRILEDQLDAMRMAQLQARQAYERQAELLQDLIDANKKAQADLQANFLKNNEEFQNQINKAIGGGATQQALGLVEQQRAATKAFREQNKGLQGQEGQLTQQQKDQARAEAERQRQAELAQAQLEQQQKLIKRQQEDADALFEHSQSANDDTDAMDAQTDALEDQRQAIQDQIDSLQAQKDAQGEVTQHIQDQIAVYEAQTDVLKAQVEAANQTLLTQKQQATLIQTIIGQIKTSSESVASLTNPMKDLLPEVKDSTLKFNLLKEAAEILNGKIRNDLVPNGIDFAALRLHILAVAAEDAAKQVQQNGQAQKAAGDQIAGAIGQAAARILSTAEELEEAVRSAGSGAPQGSFHGANGGFTAKTGGAIPAVLHPNEVVLPLSNRPRTAELLAQIIPAMANSSSSSEMAYKVPSSGSGMFNRYSAPGEINVNISPALVGALAAGRSTEIGSMFGDFSVQGATLDDMRKVAVSAVNDVFNKASSVVGRGGAMITPGSNGGGGMMPIGGGGGGGGSVLAETSGKSSGLFGRGSGGGSGGTFGRAAIKDQGWLMPV